MVAGVVGVLSWVCLHKRKRVLKWIENDMAEKLTAEISSRRQQINQTLARKEQMLREELEPIARQWFDEVDSNGDEVRSPATRLSMPNLCAAKRMRRETFLHKYYVDYVGFVDQVLDREEFVELAEKLGVKLARSDTRAIDKIMTDILDPDGRKNLQPDDMLVDFDEFFDWYTNDNV